jgi:hypothetical protein
MTDKVVYFSSSLGSGHFHEISFFILSFSRRFSSNIAPPPFSFSLIYLFSRVFYIRPKVSFSLLFAPPSHDVLTHSYDIARTLVRSSWQLLQTPPTYLCVVPPRDSSLNKCTPHNVIEIKSTRADLSRWSVVLRRHEDEDSQLTQSIALIFTV